MCQLCQRFVSRSQSKGSLFLCRRERRRRRAAPNPSVAWCSSAFAGWYRRLYLDSHLPTRPESRRLCRPPSHCGRSLRPCVQSLSQWRQSSQRRHAQKFPIHQGRRRIRHGALSGWHQGALPGDSGSFRHHCQSIPKPGQGRRLCDPQPSAWGPDHPVHGPKAGQMSKVSKGCNFGHRGYGVSSGIQFFLRLEATKALSLSFGHDDCTTDTANNRATTTSGNTTSAKNKPPTANSKRRNKNDRIGRIELNNQIFGLVWILVGFLLNCFELLWGWATACHWEERPMLRWSPMVHTQVLSPWRTSMATRPGALLAAAWYTEATLSNVPSNVPSKVRDIWWYLNIFESVRFLEICWPWISNHFLKVFMILFVPEAFCLRPVIMFNPARSWLMTVSVSKAKTTLAASAKSMPSDY